MRVRARPVAAVCAAGWLAACSGADTPPGERIPAARELDGVTEPEAEALASAVLDSDRFDGLIGGSSFTVRGSGPAFADRELIGWSFSIDAEPPVTGRFVWPFADCVDDEVALVDQEVDVAGVEQLSVTIDVEHDVVLAMTPAPTRSPVRFDVAPRSTATRVLDRSCNEAASQQEE